MHSAVNTAIIIILGGLIMSFLLRKLLFFLRDVNGLTQQKVSDKTNIPIKNISQFETGKDEHIPPEAIVLLANCYNVCHQYVEVFNEYRRLPGQRKTSKPATSFKTEYNIEQEKIALYEILKSTLKDHRMNETITVLKLIRIILGYTEEEMVYVLNNSSKVYRWKPNEIKQMENSQPDINDHQLDSFAKLLGIGNPNHLKIWLNYPRSNDDEKKETLYKLVTLAVELGETKSMEKNKKPLLGRKE